MHHLRLHPSLFTPAVAVAGALFLASNPVHAQSLHERYQSARSYDAIYLAARALAESSEHRAAQADALNRPSLALTGNASTAAVNRCRWQKGRSRIG